MTCHKYEAALCSFKPPKNKNKILRTKSKQKNAPGARPTGGLPLFTLGLDGINKCFSLLTQGLHVSTTAEPHRTVMRGGEEGARRRGDGGGSGGGLVKNYSEQHRSKGLHRHEEKQLRDRESRREGERESKRNRRGG